MKPEQQRQADTDIPPEIESIAGEGVKLFSRLINVASKSMTDKEFDHLCEAHSFGAVARNEFTLVPRAMLKALVDAAVSTEILKQQDRMRLEAGDAALNYSIGLDLQKENDALKSRIKRLEEAYSATEAVRTTRDCWCNHDPDTWTRCSTCCDKIKRYHAAKANLNRTVFNSQPQSPHQ